MESIYRPAVVEGGTYQFTMTYDRPEGPIIGKVVRIDRASGRIRITTPASRSIYTLWFSKIAGIDAV